MSTKGMSATPATFRDVIDLWPSRAGMARKVGVAAGLPLNWYLRDKIPEGRFDAVVDAARRCGFRGITYALLASLTPGAALEP